MSGRIRRLRWSGQATTAEGEVALRPPDLVRTLLEQCEPPHPKACVVRRERLERAVQHLVAYVVGHRDVRVVGEAELARQRPGADLALHAFASADAHCKGHEDDR